MPGQAGALYLEGRWGPSLPAWKAQLVALCPSVQRGKCEMCWYLRLRPDTSLGLCLGTYFLIKE